ncbi:uncharacterized protein PHALS_13607 [Plasmopara halstedii]|uniref:Uncharacterized protein n=1 Tax=Plasmopara halstedii TaxID=4781 RepID=A0A0P1AQ19_PLAHL|nr:uncharacterized protein PHALS_13607 [Plasmopara halstedii]CEG43410.1 hypothetical protein PHALS_13607 [Plasmopara halstedii]|eukprot:XP_024579779.1 hypothetical protein PHALS_13607 [Plasmopara halstedii]
MDIRDSDEKTFEVEDVAINVIPISSTEWEELAPDALNDGFKSVKKESAENAHAETSDSKDGKLGSVELDTRLPEPTACDSEELEELPGSQALSFHEEVNGVLDLMFENDNRTDIGEQAIDAKLEAEPSTVAAYGTTDEIVMSLTDAEKSAKVTDICDVVPDASSDTLMKRVQQDKIAGFKTAAVEHVGADVTDDAYKMKALTAFKDDSYSEAETPRTDVVAQSILPPISFRESMHEGKPNLLGAEVYKDEQDEYTDDDHDDRLVEDSIKFTPRADD